MAILAFIILLINTFFSEYSTYQISYLLDILPTGYPTLNIPLTEHPTYWISYIKYPTYWISYLLDILPTGYPTYQMSYLMCILPTGYPTYWIFYIQFVFNLCEETISRTDEGQPRPKYIFNKCGTNIYFFTLQRFGPSPSLNFKSQKKTKSLSQLKYIFLEKNDIKY